MVLRSLALENFRNHTKRSFDFAKTTLIIGKNTSGKTNILEAIYFLSTGKSFRAAEEGDTISFDKDFSKIRGITLHDGDRQDLSIILAVKSGRFSKKYLVNTVARRQVDFVHNFYSVLFTPEDLSIISSSPSLRRKYIDSILIQADRTYRASLAIYERSLKHRNKMLYDLREGKKYYKPQDFEYWNQILIENGETVAHKREEFIMFVNSEKKEIFDFDLVYDKSVISEERLVKYYEQERAAGVTLVGPQRDDFFFLFPHSRSEPSLQLSPSPHPNLLSTPLKQAISSLRSSEGEGILRKFGNFRGEEVKGRKLIREFGSRGQQRLTLLQIKVFEIRYLEHATGEVPTLLLDDIFSELDTANIKKVFELIPTQQTIITTTHKEFIPETFLNNNIAIIEL